MANTCKHQMIAVKEIYGFLGYVYYFVTDNVED